MSRFPSYLGLCLGALCASACGATGTTTAEPDAVTMISVDPLDFPDAAQCGAERGTGSYVAELFDVSNLVDKDTTKVIPIIQLQSSPATACNRAVAFSEVVANHLYTVKVSSYADLDGDPETTDVCTIEGTRITTLPRSDGSCPPTLAEATSLATPLTTFTCYGWRGTAVVGDVSAEDADARVDHVTKCDLVSRGCPGTALNHRTVTLRYCVEG